MKASITQLFIMIPFLTDTACAHVTNAIFLMHQFLNDVKEAINHFISRMIKTNKFLSWREFAGREKNFNDTFLEVPEEFMWVNEVSLMS